MNQFSIGETTVDPNSNEIRTGDITTRLEPKTMEVLSLLAAKAGQTVVKEEIFNAVWPGVVVSEDSIVRCICQLRKAFGNSELIEAINKRGYRLNAVVAFGAEELPVVQAASKHANVRGGRSLSWLIPPLFGLTAALAVWASGRPWTLDAALVLSAAILGIAVARKWRTTLPA